MVISLTIDKLKFPNERKRCGTGLVRFDLDNYIDCETCWLRGKQIFEDRHFKMSDPIRTVG